MTEFIDSDNLQEILRSPERIAKDPQGATPNEVAAIREGTIKIDPAELDPVEHALSPKPKKAKP